MKTQIKAFRKKRGYSQEELSKLTGIPRQSISDYETGKHSPNGTKLELIATALEIPFFALFLDVPQVPISPRELIKQPQP